jgi:outer membrane autotransporter protein
VTDDVFDGTLFGTGTVTKKGAGTLLLIGAHGVRGLTTVEEGTLALDGALAGAVTVKTDATFDATGTIAGGLTVDGTVSVRSPAAGGFGLLGAGGDVVFNPGSEYRVNVDAAGSNSALVTPGRAVIGGTTVAVAPQSNDFSRVTHYAVLRADAGLSGSATGTSSVATLEPYLSQSDTTLFATLLRMDLPLQPYAVSADGSAIAAAFDRVKGRATGDLGRVVRELTALDDVGLGAGLDMVAGEIHASATQLAAMDGGSSIDMIRDEITHRVSSRRSGLDGGQGPVGPALWRAGGRRGWLRLRTERSAFEPDGVHGGNASLHGYAMGADWVLHQRWLMGVGGSYANGRLTLDGLDESSGFTAPRGFAYVGYAGKAWALDGGLSVARTAYDIRRRFQFTAMAPTGRPLFGGVDREAASEPSGLAADVWGEARVGAMLGSWNVQPTAGVRRSHYGLTAWSETGGDALSLSASGQAIGSTQVDASVRFTRTAGRFHPFLSTRLNRELTGGRTRTTLRIGDGPDGDFDIEGLRLARQTIVGQAGFSFLRNTLGLSMWYEAHHAHRQMRHIVQFAIGVE